MSVDILRTNCDQCRSMVRCCFTSTETVRLIRTESPGRPPWLSHSSWIFILFFSFSFCTQSYEQGKILDGVIYLFAELTCLIAFVLTLFRGQTQSISSFRTRRKTRVCTLSRWAFCQNSVTGACSFVTACIDQAVQGSCKLSLIWMKEWIWCIKMSRYTQCIHVCMLINTCTWICTVYMLINACDLIQCLHVNIDNK